MNDSSCAFMVLFGFVATRLLDPANTLQFDDFKKCYGEILHRWGLKDKRADVLKFASCPPEPHKGVGEFMEILMETYLMWNSC